MEHIPMCLADRVRISRNRISAVFSQQEISQKFFQRFFFARAYDDGNRLAVYPYSCKPEDQPAGGTDQTGNPKPAGLWKQQQGTCDTDDIWQEKREKPDFSYGASLF